MEPQVNILHRVSNIVSSERSLDEMLGEIVGLTVQITECDACLVYLIETDTNEIVLSGIPGSACRRSRYAAHENGRGCYGMGR